MSLFNQSLVNKKLVGKLHKVMTLIFSVVTMLALSMLLTGCAVGYYWQAGVGHLRLVNGQEPVAELLADGNISATERERLELSQAALSFAHEQLLLPDNGSYRNYFDTGQPYVVWNVFAAPELSLEPQTWCFPLLGCIAYKGYFAQDKARAYADKLAADGADVFVGGVTAYSTLGRFRDPLLNTMLSMAEADFVGLLFHELAHQRLYIKDDSAFNESFAMAVQLEGMRLWQASRNVPDCIAPACTEPCTEPSCTEPSHTTEQRAQVLDLLRGVREQLTAVYTADTDAATKRAAKAELLDGLPGQYQQLLAGWQRDGFAGRPYEALFAGGLNNASLSAIATYDNYVPAFTALLQQCGGELACFYERAAVISALDRQQRDAQLQALLPGPLPGPLPGS